MSTIARRAHRRRLFVEPLEDRRLLAANIAPWLADRAASAAADRLSSAATSSLVSWPTASVRAGGNTSAATSSSAPSDDLNLVASNALFSTTPVGNGYSPAQIREAYGFNQLSFPGNDYNNAGTGETIAIVDAFSDPDISHDVQQFDEAFDIGGATGHPADTSFLKVVNQYGGSPQDVQGPAFSGWDAEESADVEWAHAIAPGANILLVQAATDQTQDLEAAIRYAASQPGVCTVSMSFSVSPGDEYDNEYDDDSLFTTPIGHQGVTFVAASGDSGANPNLSSYQQVSPNILVVGGTTLPADQNGNPDRSQEAGWSLGSDSYNPVLASSGAISSFEAQPPFQQGIVTQSAIYRTYPDVAFDADPDTGVPVYDSLSTPPGLPWGEFGGTSIGAPMWAALIAIADQARAADHEPSLDGPTQLLPAVYQISQVNPNAFQDITQAYNGYAAGPGYNLVTGLGTPNAQYLIPDLVQMDSTPAAPATVYWTGDAGDHNWDDPGNWSTVDPTVMNVPQSVLPGPNDNVVIDLAGAVVNHAITRYDTIRSLTISAPNAVLNLDAGTLDLSGSEKLGNFTAAGAGDIVNLMDGVLKSALVSARTTIIVPTSSASYVDGCELDGTLQALEGSTLDLEGSWNNNGTITAQTGSTLILGDYWNAAASDPGARSDAWVNYGTITASNATVELGGWLTESAKNLGSLALGSDSVQLIGTLGNSGQTLALAPGVTSATGSWFMNGGRIDGGTITTTGGAALVAVSAIVAEFGVPIPSGTLDGVTLDGTLDMSTSADVAIAGGLILDTDLYNSGDLQFDPGSFVVAGPLVHSATIYLNAPYATVFNVSSQNTGLNNDPSQTVTIGRGITIAGESYIDGVFGPFDNQGTIEQNWSGTMEVDELANEGSVQAGQSGFIVLATDGVFLDSGGFFFFAGTPWSNDAGGTIQGATLLAGQCTNDGTVDGNLQILSSTSLTNNGTVDGNLQVINDYGPIGVEYGTWTNNGTITATGPELFLEGAWTNNGTITWMGSTLDLGGAWTNNGTITADAASSVTLGDYAALVSGPGYIWKNNGTLSIAPGATLNLGDYFTTDELESGFQQQGGNFNLSQYTVNLIGILDNTAADNPISAGILSLDASTDNWSLSGGEINGGTITGSAPLVAGSDDSAGSILDCVIVDVPINLSAGASLTLNNLNNAVVDSPINVLAGGALTLQGNWSIAANGSITTTAGYLDLSGTWTNNGTITGLQGMPFGAQLDLSGTWTNNGTITAPSATLSLSGTWTNNGTITADASSIVSLDNGTNTGTLSIAPGATINLVGSFTTDEFEGGFQNLGLDLNLSQYTVNLFGTIDSSPADNPITGGRLSLNAATGPLYFESGSEINQGTITTQGSDDLVVPVWSWVTLSSVTLDGTLDMSAGWNTTQLNAVTLDGNLLYGDSTTVNAAGGLTLNADLTNYGILSIAGGLTLNADLTSYGNLSFAGGSTVSIGPLVQSATIYQNGLLLENLSSQTVTIGPGITISSTGWYSQILGPFDNQGVIEQDGPGQLSLFGVDNDGSIQAQSGGDITLDELYSNTAMPIPWSNNADGTITATQGSEVDLLNQWTNAGTITVDSSSTVSLGDMLDDDSIVPLGVSESPLMFTQSGNIWTNTGTLSIAPGATINLGDYFTTDEFESGFRQLGANFDLSQYTVNLIGTLDNSPADNPITGGTLSLNQSTGPLCLLLSNQYFVYGFGGMIVGGMVTTSGADDLVGAGGNLDQVTLDGTIDLSAAGASVYVLDGLTLDTDLNVSGAGASLILFESTGNTLAVGPLALNATIHLSGSGANLSSYDTPAIVLDPGITISGENPSSSISSTNGDSFFTTFGPPIDNLGTVVEQSGGQMTVQDLVNSGSIIVANGGTITDQGPFSNGGILAIAAGGTFSTSGADDIQWAGTTIVDGVLSADNVYVNGGFLTGAGTIQANVTNAATVVPGDHFGTLTIQGNYTQTATGILRIQIAGSNQYGQLVVTGMATLGGTLDVSLLDGYTPPLGTSFTILTFNQLSGDFATVNGLNIGDGRFFVPVYRNGALVLLVL